MSGDMVSDRMNCCGQKSLSGLLQEEGNAVNNAIIAINNSSVLFLSLPIISQAPESVIRPLSRFMRNEVNTHAENAAQNAG
jgi:hypothetical protein